MADDLSKAIPDDARKLDDDDPDRCTATRRDGDTFLWAGDRALTCDRPAGNDEHCTTVIARRKSPFTATARCKNSTTSSIRNSSSRSRRSARSWATAGVTSSRSSWQRTSRHATRTSCTRSTYICGPLPTTPSGKGTGRARTAARPWGDRLRRVQGRVYRSRGVVLAGAVPHGAWSSAATGSPGRFTGRTRSLGTRSETR